MPSAISLPPDVEALSAELYELRRQIHQQPELGFEETRTARLVASRLEGLGLEVQTGVARTGIVALVRGARPGRTVLVRADMDALPVAEETSAPYKSQVPGVMHACGHDGHTAVLIGLAKVLAAKREQIAGTVKLVFQPAEEGPGGAEPMIAAGVLEDPKVDAAIGFHLWNNLPVGQVGVRPGPIMAATDQVDITIKGKGGHGAKPHLSVDAVVVASHVVTGLQSIVSRMVNPLHSAVITMGTINGGFRHNVIAPAVSLSGTVRTYEKGLRDEMPRRIERMVRGICEAMGATYAIDYVRVYPPTVNDPAMTDLVRAAAAKVVGADNVIHVEPSMGGEDMSYFLDAVPGSYFFLGSANSERGLDQPHHSPGFDFDEAALPIGLQVLQQAVFDYLGS
ncbi:MAG: amidohydrolase [Candidatus Sericytochromatia bacterium]|nr:amidohydrolase [Candidatus Tanganyikabacteria bacterium]